MNPDTPISENSSEAEKGFVSSLMKGRCFFRSFDVYYWFILICWLLTHYFLSLKWKNKNKTTTPVRLHWLLQSDCEQQEIFGERIGDWRFWICMPDMLTPDVRRIYRLFLDAGQLHRTVRRVSRVVIFHDNVKASFALFCLLQTSANNS